MRFFLAYTIFIYIVKKKLFDRNFFSSKLSSILSKSFHFQGLEVGSELIDRQSPRKWVNPSFCSYFLVTLHEDSHIYKFWSKHPIKNKNAKSTLSSLMINQSAPLCQKTVKIKESTWTIFNR